MTHIQQALFELETDYAGHPYFVTGHALCNALGRRVDGRTRQALQASHGVFVPGEYGEYPPEHSATGRAGTLGSSLPRVETYADLFLYRDVAQRWLLESPPRDAHNVHDIQRYGDRLAFASTCRSGRPPEMQKSQRTARWFLHCYLHAESDAGVLPVDETTLETLRVGGARNYGFGELSLVDSQLVDLDQVSYSRLRDTELQLELLTPYVLASDYPGADDQDVPWWWDPERPLRRRETRLQDGGDAYALETVDHGQVVSFAGADPVRTAKNGIKRVGTHAKYGFGEFRLRPTSADRVPARSDSARGGEA
ncbi:hypothetical protein ACFQL1_16135 [Halomicroarcula sp. GCM10025709]|uniref:hypothetical protein n=1 Tax=Haloarcula TaxID=2237 RepID=UPI0024C34C25|nr:hypothetical protein [Halomicroarcula sp. YJ-61-S]